MANQLKAASTRVSDLLVAESVHGPERGNRGQGRGVLVITKKRRKSDRVKALALERAGFRFRFRRIDLPAALGASLSGGG